MKKNNPFYDIKAIRKYLIWLIVLIAATKLTAGSAAAVLVALLFFYLSKGKNELMLFVILITTTFMLMNSHIVPRGLIFNISTKVLMLSAASVLLPRIFSGKSSPVLTPLWCIFPYLAFMLISSQKGWCPMISNLKLFLFSMIFVAYYGCSSAVLKKTSNERDLRSILLSVAILIIFGSVLLLPFPGISYISSVDPVTGKMEGIPLFAGMCNHSQMLGPVVCIFGVLLYADLMYFIQRPDKLYIALLACCPLLLYQTSSRTAMASFIAGIGVATFFVMRGRGLKKAWQRKVMNVMTTAVVLISVGVVAIPPLREKAVRFVVKYEDKGGGLDTSSDGIWASREGKLQSCLYNWRRSPYIGNGFQVSENMQYAKVRSIKDVLTAPVEKSTWTYAVLEEGGIIGMVLFCLFIIVVFASLMKRRAYIGLTLFFTFILSNMGEFTIFSMSADGGLFWFLLFFGLVLDHKRLYTKPKAGLPEPQGAPARSGVGPKISQYGVRHG